MQNLGAVIAREIRQASARLQAAVRGARVNIERSVRQIERSVLRPRLVPQRKQSTLFQPRRPKLLQRQLAGEGLRAADGGGAQLRILKLRWALFVTQTVSLQALNSLGAYRRRKLTVCVTSQTIAAVSRRFFCRSSRTRSWALENSVAGLITPRHSGLSCERRLKVCLIAEAQDALIFAGKIAEEGRVEQQRMIAIVVDVFRLQTHARVMVVVKIAWRGSSMGTPWR